MNHLAVLGGSTPFTASLVDALIDRSSYLPPVKLVLHGRNDVNLSIVARYAESRLGAVGWQIASSTDLHSVVDQADIVIHQVRYGGLEARARAEEISLALGLTPDETLGPGALYCALELMPQLDQTSKVLAQACPNAWVLNLTNPLSITTARMIRQGVSRCVGLCELPRVTFREIAGILGQDPDDGEWSYVGLNHRGFITHVAWDGKDRIQEFARSLCSETFSGASAEQISALGAIPTKYFSLLSSRAPRSTTGRAAILAQLRRDILAQLRRDPHHSPPGLKKRNLAWYQWSVVPMIEALLSEQPTLQEVNKFGNTNLVEEGRAWVSKRGVGPLVSAAPVPGVAEWLRRLQDHERRLMTAAEEPSLENITKALEADPMTGSTQVGGCAQALWDRLRTCDLVEPDRTGE